MFPLIFQVGMGIYSEETIDNTIEALEIAIQLYGKPEEILTDHGTQFFSNGKKGIPGDKNKFQEYLDNNNIKHIVGRIDHPQTNGKLERLNYTIKRLRPYFSTWDEVVYNIMRYFYTLILKVFLYWQWSCQWIIIPYVYY